MRTTLIIPDAVFKRAKTVARQRGKNLSQFVSEAITLEIENLAGGVPGAEKPYCVTPISMGKPLVDISDRDVLQRVMDGE